jgi:uncharacterized protein YdeI (YjbR/CyaY-like superfamily)
MVKIRYFQSASEFRRWLEANHARTPELWVGFFKKNSGKGGLTYPEAVDEAYETAAWEQQCGTMHSN